MATRKVPLAENPNAANSPYRGHAATKRARSNTVDLENEQSPPKKKHIIDAAYVVSKPVSRSVFDEPSASERAGSRPPTSFQKRLLAEREPKQATKQASQKATVKTEVKAVVAETAADREALQNWRKHYRAAFPRFTFYYENIPTDAAARLNKQSLVLGARVEKFFSKDVTHVITTRSIPTAGGSNDGRSLPSRTTAPRPETIDPAVLNKSEIGTRTRSAADQLQRRSNASTLDSKSNASNDVLYKARDMGKKIWTLEKFQRMLQTLFDHDGSDDNDQPLKRHAGSSMLPAKRERETDLSQLLRNERNNAPVDRKPWQEIIPFRGVFVYIHDMDERTKPVMVREYSKPVKKEDGKWPMFRSVSKGRCPFVEELHPPPRDDEAETKRRQALEQARAVKPTRAAVKQQQATLEQDQCPPGTRSTTQSPKKGARPLADTTGNANQMPKPQLPASLAKAGDVPKLQRQASGSIGDMPPMLGSTHANYQGLPRKPGGEPLASGMQGNITSAIRSQMYSSTAPSALGQRVGMTKQQHQMSRRILERQSGLSNSNMPSSFSVNDVRAALNKDQPPASRHNTRLRGADKLDKIHEDEDVSEECEAANEAAVGAKRAQPTRRRTAPVKRDPKPGYCENCRDKYDDFYEHIGSKSHRRFATSTENFAELDQLLKVLVRR